VAERVRPEVIEQDRARPLARSLDAVASSMFFVWKPSLLRESSVTV
jgi:hypothetical protein